MDDEVAPDALDGSRRSYVEPDLADLPSLCACLGRPLEDLRPLLEREGVTFPPTVRRSWYYVAATRPGLELRFSLLPDEWGRWVLDLVKAELPAYTGPLVGGLIPGMSRAEVRRMLGVPPHTNVRADVWEWEGRELLVRFHDSDRVLLVIANLVEGAVVDDPRP
jgi:hypothetical protein